MGAYWKIEAISLEFFLGNLDKLKYEILLNIKTKLISLLVAIKYLFSH